MVENKEDMKILQANFNVLPFILCPNESIGDNVLAISASSALRWNFSNDQSGIIDVRSLSAMATSDEFLIEIIESSRNSSCSNRPLHGKTILGTFGKPFKLPHPFVLPKLQTIQVELSDLSGSTNNVRLGFNGNKHFATDLRDYYKTAQLGDMYRSFFFTTDSNVSIASASSDQNFISIEQGDFICMGINAHSTGNFTFRIYDVNLGRGWQNGYAPKSCLGSGEYQHEFFTPTLLKKKTKLRIEFVNLHNDTNNIYLTFYGVLKVG